MNRISTLCFLSDSEHDQVIMKSLFNIIGAREQYEWQLDNAPHDVDVLLIDADDISNPPAQLKSTYHAKIVVAYTSHPLHPSGFDAYLKKPTRARSLLNLLRFLKGELSKHTFNPAM